MPVLIGWRTVFLHKINMVRIHLKLEAGFTLDASVNCANQHARANVDGELLHDPTELVVTLALCRLLCFVSPETHILHLSLVANSNFFQQLI